MGEESGHAALQVSLFSGTCYLTPLLGAWLADSMWGRYKTIMVFSLIYFLVRQDLHWVVTLSSRSAPGWDLSIMTGTRLQLPGAERCTGLLRRSEDAAAKCIAFGTLLITMPTAHHIWLHAAVHCHTSMIH